MPLVLLNLLLLLQLSLLLRFSPKSLLLLQALP
jgi:hypothetical protein